MASSLALKRLVSSNLLPKYSLRRATCQAIPWRVSSNLLPKYSQLPATRQPIQPTHSAFPLLNTNARTVQDVYIVYDRSNDEDHSDDDDGNNAEDPTPGDDDDDGSDDEDGSDTVDLMITIHSGEDDSSDDDNDHSDDDNDHSYDDGLMIIARIATIMIIATIMNYWIVKSRLG